MTYEDFFSIDVQSQYRMEYMADHVRWRCRVPQVEIEVPSMTASALYAGSPACPPTTSMKVFVSAQDFAVDILIEDWGEVSKMDSLLEYYEDMAVQQLLPLVKAHLQPLVDAGVINE